MAQNFLFVNHDAKTVGVRIDNEAVNAHVQFYQHRRNRDKSRKLTRQALPADRLRPLRPVKDVQRDATAAIVKQPVEPDLSDSLKSSSESPEDSSASAPPTVSALTILAKGNTDPFSALAIPITPMINSILAYHRDKGIPGLYPVESRLPNSTSGAMLRTWQDGVTSLHHPGQGFPFLASIAASMARKTGSQDVAKLSLSCKGQSYQALRTHLGGQSDLRTFKTYDMMIWMFWANIEAGDRAEASLHLRMLAKLVNTHDEVKKFDSWWRERLMCADVILAIWGMTRPFFEAERWSFEEAYQDWREELKDSEMKTITSISINLDDSMTDQRLRTILIQLRELLLVERLLTERGLTTNSALRWMSARHLGCESRLMSYYVDVSSPSSGDRDQSSGSLDQDPILTYTCIAAISFTGMMFGSKNRSQASIMASRLQTAIMHSDQDTWQAILYQRLRLWALFVGASLEQISGCDLGVGSCRNHWHTKNFAMQARSMGLRSWNEIRRVLQGFLYSDRINPQGLAWCR